MQGFDLFADEDLWRSSGRKAPVRVYATFPPSRGHPMPFRFPEQVHDTVAGWCRRRQRVPASSHLATHPPAIGSTQLGHAPNRALRLVCTLWSFPCGIAAELWRHPGLSRCLPPRAASGRARQFQVVQRADRVMCAMLPTPYRSMRLFA